MVDIICIISIIVGSFYTLGIGLILMAWPRSLSKTFRIAKISPHPKQASRAEGRAYQIAIGFVTFVCVLTSLVLGSVFYSHQLLVEDQLFWQGCWIALAMNFGDAIFLDMGLIPMQSEFFSQACEIGVQELNRGKIFWKLTLWEHGIIIPLIVVPIFGRVYQWLILL